METNVETLEALVRAKIENLRPKLLDLSRRNPLIATKLGPRSNSHIRAVDELPDVPNSLQSPAHLRICSAYFRCPSWVDRGGFASARAVVDRKPRRHSERQRAGMPKN